MKYIITYLLSLLLMLTVAPLSAEELHRPWNLLLKRYVSGTNVDYQGFKKSEKDLDEYLEMLNNSDPAALDRQDKLAFYINAYNSYTVKWILVNFEDGKPPVSIKKTVGFFSNPWKIDFVKIGGKSFTLDNIEHDIIRKQFTEPRIHFAVNCASKSCPPLISEAYEGDRLEAQLEKSTRDFLADTKTNYLKDNKLYVSSIFKWYSEDFDNDPVKFFLSHADSKLKEQIQQLRDIISVRYLDYDWSLNNQELKDQD